MTFLDQKERDPQTWTEPRVEQLKKLWADGLSASQIAGELGGITRNAVIGKVHRLGLSGRARAPSLCIPRQRKPRAPSQMFRAPRLMMRGNTALAQMPQYDYEPEPELIENVIPIGQRCALIELDHEKCHWPIGEPGQSGFFFCGGKTAGGRTGTGVDSSPFPYCGYHGRVAYQSAADRRRSKQSVKPAYRVPHAMFATA